MKRPYIIKEVRPLFCFLYPEFFIQAKDGDEPDIYLMYYDPMTEPNLKPEPKTIYRLAIDNKIHRRKNIRVSDLSDQHYLNNTAFDGITFNTHLDLRGENIISKVLPHMPCDKISKNKDYFKETINEEFKFYNKCFWRGGNTHITRTKVIDFLKTGNPSRYYAYQVLAILFNKGIAVNMDDLKEQPGYQGTSGAGDQGIIGRWIQSDREKGRTSGLD